MGRIIMFRYPGTAGAAFDIHWHKKLPSVNCVVRTMGMYCSAGTSSLLLYASGSVATINEYLCGYTTTGTHGLAPYMSVLVPGTDLTIRYTGSAAASYCFVVYVEVLP